MMEKSNRDQDPPAKQLQSQSISSSKVQKILYNTKNTMDKISVRWTIQMLQTESLVYFDFIDDALHVIARGY